MKGAGEGVLFYLKPDFSRLADPQVTKIRKKVGFQVSPREKNSWGTLYFIYKLCFVTRYVKSFVSRYFHMGVDRGVSTAHWRSSSGDQAIISHR